MEILDYQWADTLGFIIIIIFTIFMVIGFIAILINTVIHNPYHITSIFNKNYIIRKDCVHCEKDDIGVLGCILFKYKLDRNFNCSECKKYKSK